MTVTSLRFDLLDAQVAMASILIGAARSDAFFAANELVALIDIMQQIVGSKDLPDRVSLCIQTAEALQSDEAMFAAVNALGTLDSQQATAVMTVAAALVESDQVIHDAEEHYLQRLQRALGLRAPPPLP